MSDVMIFGMGCIVSMVVLGAVGLLFWGAANEPEEVFDSTSKEARDITGDRFQSRAPIRNDRITTRNTA